MSSEKQLDKYSKSYFWFFERAQQAAFSVACDSVQQARSLRDELYNYRKVYCEANPGSNECRMLQEVTIIKDGAIITGEPRR